MATSKEEFESVIKLIQKLNTSLIKAGKNANDMFKGLADFKGLDKLVKAEKSIEELRKVNEALVKLKEEEKKINTQLQKQHTEERKNREKTAKAVSETQKIQAKINKARSEEGQQLANLRAELKKVNAENRANAESLVTQNDEYKKLTKRTNEAQANFKKIAAELGVNSKEAKIARKEFDKLDDELREINDAAKDGRRDVGRYRQEISKLSEEMKAAANKAGGFGDILENVTSPVGVASAIIGGLGAAFTSTQEGSNLLNDGLAYLKGGFNAATESGVNFVKGLANGQGILEAYQKNIEGVTDRINKQGKAGTRANELQRKNRIELRSTSQELANLRGEYELLQQQAGDATTTLEQQQESVIKSQEKAVEIAQKEIELVQKEIEAVNLRLEAEGTGKNRPELLDQKQEFINQQIELEATLNTELRTLNTERRQIEQDQFEQRLDFLFDASDRQKSITESQLANDRISTEERIKMFEKLKVSLFKTYNEIEKEFTQLSGQQINIAKIANLEATEQAELLKTLNLSEAGRTRLKEAVVEYLQVVQDLKEDQEDLNEVEQQTIELQKEIELQRRKLAGEDIDLEKELTEFKIEQLKKQIEALDKNSIERLTKQKELYGLLLAAEADFQKDLEKLKSRGAMQSKESSRKLNTTAGNETLKANEEAIAKQKALEEKAAQERQELMNASVDIAKSLNAKITENKLNQLDEELSAIEERDSQLRSLAEKGSEDAVKSLDAAAKREAQIRQEKEKALMREKSIEAGLSAFKLMAAKTEQGDENAVGSTIADLTKLASIIPTLLQGFHDGTENTGDKGVLKDKHGVITGYTHKNERVLTEKQNKKIGSLSNEKLTEVAEMYNKGLFNVESVNIPQQRYQSNEELIKHVISLENAIKRLPKQMQKDNYSFDAFTGALKYSKSLGNSTQTKGYIID